ncbi:MAG: hypothetical protein ACLQDV_20055 [Candidatus Binataceae bacterium]
MRQHDPRDLYALGIVHRLLELKVGHRISEYREIFTQVTFILEQFIQNDFNIRYTPNAVDAATQLRIYTAVFGGADADTDFVLDEGTLEQLLRKGLVGHFESALSIDFKALPLFLIEDKRGYSSVAFQRDASVVFSEADRKSLAPLTLSDIQEAGRCLLLDRHTAAGFHTMRALEAVARGYYRMIFNAEPVNKNNGLPLGLVAIADYLKKYKNKLESAKKPTGGLEDVISPLERIARIYRNNIMHPEMTLDEDLAIEVFDDAKSVIAAMLRDARTGGSHCKVSWATWTFSWAWSLSTA